jgi:hypothetical protein
VPTRGLAACALIPPLKGEGGSACLRGAGWGYAVYGTNATNVPRSIGRNLERPDSNYQIYLFRFECFWTVRPDLYFQVGGSLDYLF